MPTQTPKRRAVPSERTRKLVRGDHDVDANDLEILAQLTPTQLASLVRTVRSIDALIPAVERADVSATPATARAVQATENVYRSVGDEFGYLSSSEVATMLSSKGPHRSLAADLRKQGKLLGVHRLNKYLYPGFQFDAQTGQVKPVMERLLAVARKAEWDDDDLLLWLASPTTYFEDHRRPVDHLDSPDAVVDTLARSAHVQW